MASGFDVSTMAGLGKLNGILGRQSYIVGYGTDLDRISVTIFFVSPAAAVVL